MMMREQRAKQFIPYDAMKGLAEALRDREERHSRTVRHGVSEEAAERIRDALLRMEKGSKVTVSHYARFHDLETEGIVTEISRAYRFFRLNGEKILFEDLYDIRITG